MVFSPVRIGRCPTLARLRGCIDSVSLSTFVRSSSRATTGPIDEEGVVELPRGRFLLSPRVAEGGEGGGREGENQHGC